MALPGRPIRRLFQFLFARASEDTARYADGTTETVRWGQGVLRNPAFVSLGISFVAWVLNAFGVDVSQVNVGEVEAGLTQVIGTISGFIGMFLVKDRVTAT